VNEEKEIELNNRGSRVGAPHCSNLELSIVLKTMNINELTSQQLSQAASIQEKLDSLHKELRGFLNAITTKPISKKKRIMRVAGEGKARLRRAGRR